MPQSEVLGTVRLHIANQARLINQIAGTYKDVYRSMMEYVDNAADAAATLSKKQGKLEVTVDTSAREVTFTDNCHGMSPEKLGDLLGSIGKSTKPHLPWVNGEFGFGVHAFRGFAAFAEFTSRAQGSPTCTITIDREADETHEIEIKRAPDDLIPTPTGTRVRIHGFRIGVFKGPQFVSRLRQEIEAHFDDVIQNGILEITIRDSKGRVSEPCKPADVGGMSGTPIKKVVNLTVRGHSRPLSVDVKLVEGPPPRHPISLTRNGRRILPVAELRSYRNHLRAKNKDAQVWNHPALAGRIEIGEIARPNISRDDLQDDEGREALFEALEAVQEELETAISDLQSKTRDRSLNSAARLLSERLAKVMKRFDTVFRRPVPAPGSGSSLGESGKGIAPGGESPGGGGPGETPGAGSSKSTGDGGTGLGRGGLGSGSRGASEATGSGASPGGLAKAEGGPELLFAHLDPSIRCQLVGYQITVNEDHPAFKARAPSDGSLDWRLLNHIARIISPVLTQKQYEARREIPIPLEFGERAAELSIMIEDDFTDHEAEIVIAVKYDLAGTEPTETNEP